MARLCWAQLLVCWVPFERWRPGLGLSAGGPDRQTGSLDLARQMAADVAWAGKRLFFPTKCLPQAMALSWMLSHRRISHSVVIAVRPNQLRQSPDAMHAWIEVDGDKVIGDLPGPWIEMLRVGEP